MRSKGHRPSSAQARTPVYGRQYIHYRYIDTVCWWHLWPHNWTCNVRTCLTVVSDISNRKVHRTWCSSPVQLTTWTNIYQNWIRALTKTGCLTSPLFSVPTYSSKIHVFSSCLLFIYVSSESYKTSLPQHISSVSMYEVRRNQCCF